MLQGQTTYCHIVAHAKFYHYFITFYLYKSLIDPLFVYGEIVYNGCPKYQKRKLHTHQNISLRSILNASAYFPTQQVKV